VNVAGSPFRKELVFEEFGDLLFTLAQEARHLGFNAEDALAAANAKFMARFKNLELIAAEQRADKPLDGRSMEELEALWQEAKRRTPKMS
jgi:hypothetical protein